MESLQSKLTTGLLLVIFVLGIYFRLQTWNIPPVLTADEASIGMNAGDILRTGSDQWGVRFPIFFKAFGEYKSPIFIYLLVPLIKIFGLSLQTIRLESALWGIGLAVVMTLLAFKIFKEIKVSLLAGILVLFTPGLVSLSHLGFEVVVFPTLIALALLLLNSKKEALIVASGFIWGLTVYSYPTARLLAWLYCGLAVIIIIKNNRDRIFTSAVFIITVIPFIVSASQNMAIVLNRLSQISILSRPNMLQSLLDNILKILSPQFLFISGSRDLLFSSQFRGLLLISTIPFLILGITVLIKKCLVKDRWAIFIILATLISPVASILTFDNQPHLLRIANILPFIIIIMVYGICYLKTQGNKVLSSLVLISFVIEATLYTLDFTFRYPQRAKLDPGIFVNAAKSFDPIELAKFNL
ncbi:MAG: hypothetical protein NT141_03450 [candidate division WWE3 bacterium]|nr:hypothetical protein [candidate division WWE3 bacterium]